MNKIKEMKKDLTRFTVEEKLNLADKWGDELLNLMIASINELQKGKYKNFYENLSQNGKDKVDISLKFIQNVFQEYIGFALIGEQYNEIFDALDFKMQQSDAIECLQASTWGNEFLRNYAILYKKVHQVIKSEILDKEYRKKLEQ